MFSTNEQTSVPSSPNFYKYEISLLLFNSLNILNNQKLLFGEFGLAIHGSADAFALVN
jgi:hypothetical protein